MVGVHQCMYLKIENDEVKMANHVFVLFEGTQLEHIWKTQLMGRVICGALLTCLPLVHGKKSICKPTFSFSWGI